MPDAEIEAMSQVADAVATLDDETQGRVLRWAAERFGVVLSGHLPSRGDKPDALDDHDQGDGDVDGGGGIARETIAKSRRGFDHFAELYDALDPKTDAEKVLVASYWFQVIKGKSPLGSLELNKELKDLGHGVGTINRAMSTNIQKRPALILQVSRGGATKQSRKKYKLTAAGEKWVASRLA